MPYHFVQSCVLFRLFNFSQATQKAEASCIYMLYMFIKLHKFYTFRSTDILHLEAYICNHVHKWNTFIHAFVLPKSCNPKSKTKCQGAQQLEGKQLETNQIKLNKIKIKRRRTWKNRTAFAFSFKQKWKKWRNKQKEQKQTVHCSHVAYVLFEGSLLLNPSFLNLYHSPHFLSVLFLPSLFIPASMSCFPPLFPQFQIFIRFLPPLPVHFRSSHLLNNIFVTHSLSPYYLLYSTTQESSVLHPSLLKVCSSIFLPYSSSSIPIIFFPSHSFSIPCSFFLP